MLKELKKFLENTTNTTDIFHISNSDLNFSLIGRTEIEGVNNTLDSFRANGLIIVNTDALGMDVLMTEKAINRGPQTGLEGDKRVSDPVVDDGNPFRPRYRKLSLEEAELHDEIKNKAYELWLLFDKAVDVQEVKINFNPMSDSDSVLWGKVNRECALARTALEDAVVRAVKALTA